MIAKFTLVALASVILLYSNASHSALTNGAVTVLMEKASSGVVYHVQKSRVKSESLVDVLSKMLVQKGRTSLVVVVVDDQIDIRSINNLRGILGKVGFSNARYFFKAKGAPRMADFLFGQVEVYEDNP